MKTMSLKLCPVLYDRLSTAASRSRKTRSAVVREAIQQYLASPGDDEGRSVLTQAADLAGVLAGPKDLSCNPKYLDGYGR